MESSFRPRSQQCHNLGGKLIRKNRKWCQGSQKDTSLSTGMRILKGCYAPTVRQGEAECLSDKATTYGLAHRLWNLEDHVLWGNFLFCVWILHNRVCDLYFLIILDHIHSGELKVPLFNYSYNFIFTEAVTS